MRSHTFQCETSQEVGKELGGNEAMFDEITVQETIWQKNMK